MPKQNGEPTRAELKQINRAIAAADRGARGVNHPALRTAATEEHGRLFRTGSPVDVPFCRNTVPAPKNLQADYGQKIEPAGRFMLHDDDAKRAAPRGWEKGVVRFQNPIVLEHVTTTSDATGWKARLSAAFGGKRGKALSVAIVEQGYDGIITTDKYGTLEIVDLTRLYAQMYGSR